MIMFVLSGISGSGKSTAAKNIAAGYDSYVICSTDNYFMVGGEYKFNSSKIGEYHKKNQAAAEDACKNKIPCVIIDNTNLQLWEAKTYFDIAHKYGYEIVFRRIYADLETSDRNVHGVTRDIRERMQKKMEPESVFLDYIKGLNGK